MLAPRRCRTFLTYITGMAQSNQTKAETNVTSGWITICGWQAVTASAAYLIGTLIQGLIALTHPSYSPVPWQGMLFLWAIVLFSVFVNTVASRALARFEGVIFLLHLFGFFAVLAPLVALGPHGQPSIFTTFLNEGNWSTQALSFFVGLPGAVFSLIGACGMYRFGGTC